jgi:hypothetical protein
LVRAIALLFLVLISAGAGTLLRGCVEAASARGPNLRCLAGERICVGQRYEAVVNLYQLDRRLGDIVTMICGFEEPGRASASSPYFFPPDIPRNCQSARFMVSRSNGNILTNFWVAQGTIVRIDEYPAHAFES